MILIKSIIMLVVVVAYIQRLSPTFLDIFADILALRDIYFCIYIIKFDKEKETGMSAVA